MPILYEIKWKSSPIYSFKVTSTYAEPATVNTLLLPVKMFFFDLFSFCYTLFLSNNFTNIRLPLCIWQIAKQPTQISFSLSC